MATKEPQELRNIHKHFEKVSIVAIVKLCVHDGEAGF
jgi:ABC-type sugar transport system ATPase subunit